MDRRSCSLKGMIGSLCLALLAVALPAPSVQAEERAGRPIEKLVLNNVTLNEFARLISEGSGFSVIVSAEASEVIISVFLEQVAIEDAIKSICRAYGLWYKMHKESNMIEIFTLDEYRETANIYAEEKVEVITILYPTVQKIGDALKDIFQDRVVWVEPSTNDYDMTRMNDAMDRMYAIKDGGGEFNLAKSFSTSSSESTYDQDYDDRTDNGRSFDNRDNYTSRRNSTVSSRNDGETRRTSQERGQKLSPDAILNGAPVGVEKMRGEALQDLAQAKRIRSFRENVGRPGAVYVSAMLHTNSLLLRSIDHQSLEQVKEVVRRLDRATPQVLLEVKMLEVTVSDERAIGIDWLFNGLDYRLGGKFDAEKTSASFGPEAGIGTTFDALSQNTGGAKVSSMLNGIDPRAVVFSYISRDINLRIKALENKGYLRSLGTPNLIVADGEASQLFIGKETTILQGVNISSSTRGENAEQMDTLIQPTSNRVKVGRSLFITPQIHADRTVTIRIMQTNSSLGDSKQIRYGGEESSFFETQDIESRSVTTTAIAGDGNIVAISGLVEEKETESNRSVPYVSKIPLVGKAFQSKSKNGTRTEMLMLIRPFVLLGPEEAQKASMDFIERISAHPSAKGDLPELGIGRIKTGKTAATEAEAFHERGFSSAQGARMKIYSNHPGDFGEELSATGEDDLLGLAAKLESQNSFPMALARYRETIQTKPGTEEEKRARIGAARCLMNLHKLDAAIVSLQPLPSKVNTAADRHMLAMSGEVLMRMKNPIAAESVLELALSSLDFTATPQRWVGNACANLAKAYMLNNKAELSAKLSGMAAEQYTQLGQNEVAQECLAFSVKAGD